MKKLYHYFLFLIQISLYYLLYPLGMLLYKKKHPWIICERGDDARDNGYTLFEYLSIEHPYVNEYYLINKKSVDREKLLKINPKRIVKYKSIKHWLLYIASEARLTTHLAAFAPGNYIGEYFKRHKHKGINVFLQHGITHNEFPSNYFEHNGSDIFVCGAKPEYDHISLNCHYPKENVIYSGFARFDKLHNLTTKRQILIMPSWRSYLYGVSKEEFKNSKYFKAWIELLKNEYLGTFHNLMSTVIFYPHYSMQGYIDCFKEENLPSNIIIADFDHYDVQKLLRESSLLITDYSSILFDYAYMRKPQLLYQFDEDEFYGKHYLHSYFDHRRDGFGKVITSSTELVEEIKRIVSNNFTLDKEYQDKINAFFPIYDTLNCERIYQSVVKKIISKKKIKGNIKDINITFTGDDYARNKESSEGIREAFKLGYIDRASIMVNKDEKDNIDVKGVDIDKINFHFNILEGYQTYGDTSIYAYSVNQDTLARRINTRKAFLKISKCDKEIIAKELRAQLDKYVSLGFKCVYFDSHGHTHNKLPIAKIIIPILKEYGFTHARIPMNIRHTHLLFDLLYKSRVIRLYRKNFITTDYFCNCDELIHISNYKKYKGKSIEVMTHPFVNEYGQLVNRRDIDFSLISNKK